MRLSADLCGERRRGERPGLSVAELNGREGEVVQFGRDRVGVRYPDRGPIALRPERLRLLRAPPPPAAEPEPQPDGGAAKRRRQEDLEKQEALAISKRFVECLHEDPAHRLRRISSK